MCYTVVDAQDMVQSICAAVCAETDSTHMGIAVWKPGTSGTLYVDAYGEVLDAPSALWEHGSWGPRAREMWLQQFQWQQQHNAFKVVGHPDAAKLSELLLVCLTSWKKGGQ